MLTTPPTFCTPRRPDLATRGARTAAVAAGVLGRPFLPWQRTTADLFGEHVGGLRVHRLCVLTIPRQAGKTTELFADAVERCMTTPGYRVFYTAQTGQVAREKWQELAEQLTGPTSPVRRFVRMRLTNGAERLVFTRTGAQIRPFPPTVGAMHSFSSDLVIVDEAWKLSADAGAAVLAGASPTQATRPGRQLVIVSTAGTADSTFLRPLVDRGRNGDPGLTYLEWTLPDDADPLDVDTVCAYHPAVGPGGLIEADFIRSERWETFVDRPAEFARGYANVWSATVERVIPRPVWDAAVTVTRQPVDVPLVLAADVAQDRTRAAIVSCAGGILEVVESRSGTDWVADRMVELIEAHDPAAVVVDRGGPSAILADDLERAGVPLFPVSSTQYATACARFIDDIEHRTLRYRVHPALDAAVDAAARRNVGDGWVWARRGAAAPICELVAGTLAGWADTHRPAPLRRPVARV